MLKEIEVIGLYGAFDHPIVLKDENINLILGENGLGKTLILKMINAFFCKDFLEIYSFHFQKFILTFDDGIKIVVEKSENSDQEALVITKLPESKKTKKEVYNIPIFIRQRRSRYRDRDRDNKYYDFQEDIHYMIRHYLPFPVERIAPDRWLDLKNDITLTGRELLQIHREYFPKDLINKIENSTFFENGFPEWLSSKTESLTSIFIETQRLLIKSDEEKYRSSIIKYSLELAEIIRNKTVIATDLGSRLDKSYPNRVIKQITQRRQITDTAISEGLERLNEKRALLNKVGLLDTNEEEDLDPSSYLSGTKQSGNKDLLRDVLQVYIDDSNQKLIVYDDLALKLELLINIINKRFLHKKMSIDKKEGFVFQSMKTNKPIPLSGLSSGEQHELVLFYQLLFNTKPNSLLLIDEPEISLHVTWQNHFIEDLREVIKLNKFSAIIATHSPDIINNNWNLTIELEGA
ncbi:MAG: AAA family ATPase [Dysgonomonas sp.]|uniref:AAA family ATPase n=1 Tax=Dysgonomonas sp. TaxID=1891233 RepID=UPI0039E70E2E